MHWRYISLFCLFLGIQTDAIGQIAFSEDPIVQGREVILTFSEPISEVVFTYRPNSTVAEVDSVVFPNPAAQYTWTPEKAGVVKVQAGKYSTNVSVRYDGLSLSGLVIMIGAAIILFGGVFLAFRILFRDEEEDGTMDLDPNNLPDT